MKTKSLVTRSVAVMAMLSLGLGTMMGVGVQQAQAASLTESSVRLGRMVLSQADNQILVIAKVASTATEDQVVVDFADNGDFNVDITPANITTSTAGLPAQYHGEAVTAWPGLSAASTSVTNEVVEFTSGDLTVGTLYGFYITAGIDNPAVAGAYTINISTKAAAAVVDSGNVAVRIVNAGTPDADQLEITATVPPTLNCTLSANTDTFTTDLDPASVVSTTGVTYTIVTNDSNGWISWVQSANQGLDSIAAGGSIATAGAIDDTPSVLVAGTEGYVLDVNINTDSATGGTGTVTVDAEYDGAVSGGGTLPAVLEEVATSNGPTDGDILDFISRAAISGLTAAAVDYTDTQTYVCAGNF